MSFYRLAPLPENLELLLKLAKTENSTTRTRPLGLARSRNPGALPFWREDDGKARPHENSGVLWPDSPAATPDGGNCGRNWMDLLAPDGTFPGTPKRKSGCETCCTALVGPTGPAICALTANWAAWAPSGRQPGLEKRKGRAAHQRADVLPARPGARSIRFPRRPGWRC